jgi:cathepsin A (carboxypeptidase C)
MKRAVVLLASLSVATAFHVPPQVQDAYDLLNNVPLPQLPWTNPSASVPPLSILTPASDITLSSIRAEEYHILTSPLHPDHKVRIKSTDGWCDPKARSYTG